MSPWYYNPHTGGTPISPKVQEETRAKILALAKKNQFKNILRLEIRFKGSLCYIYAFEKDYPEVPTHICRLRYFDLMNHWSLAFYTYSHEKYEPCLFVTGKETGTLEEAWQTVCSAYLS